MYYPICNMQMSFLEWFLKKQRELFCKITVLLFQEGQILGCNAMLCRTSNFHRNPFLPFPAIPLSFFSCSSNFAEQLVFPALVNSY